MYPYLVYYFATSVIQNKYLLVPLSHCIHLVTHFIFLLFVTKEVLDFVMGVKSDMLWLVMDPTQGAVSLCPTDGHCK